MKRLGIYFVFIALFSCSKETHKAIFDANDLIHCNRRLLEIAMEDGFSPPQASRVYAYPHLAFYVSLSNFYPDSLVKLENIVTDLSNNKIPKCSNCDPELSSLLCFASVARLVVFSEHLADQLSEEILKKAKEKINSSTIESSIEYSKQFSGLFKEWIKKDNYQYTRTLERFTSTKKPENWKETPPDYTQGLEPHWPKIRKLILDTTYNYTALPSFDTSKTSDFYKMVYDVYANANKLDSNQIEAALYWDDNPNVSQHTGHLSRIIHKISPPGHWLNIIGLISRNQKSNLFKTTTAFTLASIAMFDGIIDCWNTKYSTDVVRPISYIMDNIDVSWKPLIQTPPFPEFTSGHSVVSAAAAEILTYIYGDTFQFVDSTEILFGHPIRKFDNFHQAAMEVSLSRYYGGIHYKESVLEGNKQGIFIARQIINKINSSKQK